MEGEVFEVGGGGKVRWDCETSANNTECVRDKVKNSMPSRAMLTSDIGQVVSVSGLHLPLSFPMSSGHFPRQGILSQHQLQSIWIISSSSSGGGRSEWFDVVVVEVGEVVVDEEVGRGRQVG